MTNLTTATFDDFIRNAENPVLVDFWAEWCPPCRMQGPILEEMDVLHSGKVDFCKLNVSENEELARRYQVMNIPSLLLFKNGALDKRIEGLRSRTELEAFLGVSA